MLTWSGNISIRKRKSLPTMNKTAGVLNLDRLEAAQRIESERGTLSATSLGTRVGKQYV